jgi:hypothetical protein
VSANTVKRKVGRKVTPKSAWKKGQSGNPTGAPKRGQSWREIVKEVGNLTPAEADEYCHLIAQKIKSLGDGVTLKQAVILRVFTALLFEPDARLLAVIMDRDEGKVAQPIELSWREKLQEAGLDPDDAVQQVREWLAAGGAVSEGESNGG